MLWVTSLTTHRVLAGHPVIAIVTWTLKGFVDAPPKLAVRPGLADRTVGSTPTRMTSKSRIILEYFFAEIPQMAPNNALLADLCRIILTHTSLASRILHSDNPRILLKLKWNICIASNFERKWNEKCLTSVTKHSRPTRLADALQAAIAVPVDTPRKTDTFLTKLSSPENKHSFLGCGNFGEKCW